MGCPEGMILTPNKKSCEYKDLDCEDFSDKNFNVNEADPYDLDRDNDGKACETPGGGSGGGSDNGNGGGTSRNTVTQTGTIIIQDRTGSITATPNCAPIERTVSLGPSTMAEEGMRVIATLSPCHLLDGTVMLNLPANGIQLVAANVVAGQPVKAIAVNKQLVANLGNGQALYSIDLGERMSGTIPNKGTQSTLNDNINTILLWNDAGKSVNFKADNNLALNILSHR